MHIVKTEGIRLERPDLHRALTVLALATAPICEVAVKVSLIGGDG